MIFSVSSDKAGMNLRTIDIIIAKSWTGTLILFSGDNKDSMEYVSCIGVVVKEINIAVDEVRKKEVEDEKELKKSKYIWLKNPDHLKDYQKEKLIKMSKMNLKTAKAYRIKLI